MRAKYQVWKDFKAMFGFGDEEVNKKEASRLTSEEEDDEIEDEEDDEEEDEEGTFDVIPVKTAEAKLKIESAILQDKAALHRYKTMKEEYPELNLDPKITKDMGAYKMANDAAMHRHKTLRYVTRRA